MKNSIAKEAARRRIINRLRRMSSYLGQTIRDKQWWNNNRLDAAPYDIGWDLEMKRAVEQCLCAWESNNITAANRLNDQLQELSKSAPDIE